MRTPGEIIDGRYLVRGLLGRGGMAEVFRATDTETDRGVAVKMLRGIEPGSARRFRSEVDVLARLDHPGMVRLRGSGTHDGVPYLVLDLADGPSLADELVGGALGLDRALAVGEQVADALAHAHCVGIVHRDVKPSNILFDEAGRARLADFGIARLAGAPSLTRTGQLVGSAPYLAPEQVEGAQAGPAADVYALGLVVVECLTGRPCYAGGHIEAALTRLHRPPDVPFDLPRWLRDVLSAMTARDPRRRPAADAAAEALRRRTAAPVLATAAPLDVLAATSRQDGDVTTEPPQTLAARAHHDAEATTALPDLAAARTVASPLATPADGTAVLPGGLSAHSSGRRRTLGGGLTTLVAGAVAAVLVVSVLVWLVVGNDTSGNRPPAPSDPAPIVASTTIAPTPPSAADGEAQPSAGQENGHGSGNGRGNGHGKVKD